MCSCGPKIKQVFCFTEPAQAADQSGEAQEGETTEEKPEETDQSADPATGEAAEEAEQPAE